MNNCVVFKTLLLRTPSQQGKVADRPDGGIKQLFQNFFLTIVMVFFKLRERSFKELLILTPPSGLSATFPCWEGVLSGTNRLDW